MKATAFDRSNICQFALIYARLELEISDLPQTANMIGRDARNEYFAADSDFIPIIRPVIIVEPERETPGIKAKTCANPIANALLCGNFSSSVSERCGRLLTKIIRSPTVPIAIAIVVRLEKKLCCSINLDNRSPIMPAGIDVIKRFNAIWRSCFTKTCFKILKISLR